MGRLTSLPSAVITDDSALGGAISIISFSIHKTGAAGTTLLAGASLNFS